MLLSELTDALAEKEVIGGDAEIEKLCMSDKEAGRGSLYFCIKGNRYDGHDFAQRAVAKGAVAVVCSKKLGLGVPEVVVGDVREAMSLMAGRFYSNPADKMRIIGVTGTNGKTTTCHIIANILKKAGRKVGIIGTLGIKYGKVSIAPEMTTPDPIYLHRIFSDMADDGVEDVVMEVSAHAAALKKIAGIYFDAGVFTNLTEDHLDFFGTMEEYGRAKEEFLSDKYCDFIVLNGDDEMGRRLYFKSGRKTLSYGIDEPSDVFAVNVKEEINGISFVMNLFDNIYNIRCGMPGVFSVYNCLAAATCCAVLGVDFDDIAEGIRLTEGVKGRVEAVENPLGKKIFIDYAHTPDGLKKILQALRKCTSGRLLCLFGCGGNRESAKRPLMGEIAGEYADFCIVTSDNPRYEDPCDIISDIEKGLRLKTERYITIQDRRAAIKYAVGMMREGDILLVAGKGAEEYQEILGVKHVFSDRQCIEELLGGKGV